MRIVLIALLAWTVVFGQTYDADLAKERLAYAKATTEEFERDDRGIFLLAVGKRNATLMLIVVSTKWTREAVDSYVRNRQEDWKEYGFEKIVFARARMNGKKMTTETYAVFKIKKS